MQKCLVCGEIFDDDVEICPVCGVGKENFVPVEESELTFERNTKEVFLILGGGAAAVSAAEAVRTRNKTCSIVILSAESAMPYNRPMLTKSFAGSLDENQLAMHKEEWYKEKNIFVLTDRTVASMNPAEKLVVLSDGSNLQYDKCIYALGSHSFVPPMEGGDLENVFTLRTIADVHRIKAAANAAESVVVVGGGVLGLETAWELCKMGLQVHVLDSGDHIMSKQLNKKAGDMLYEAAKKNGIDVVFNARASQLCGDGKVNGVILKDGTLLEAQMVVLSTGVRANMEIAKEAGIECGRSVIVDEHMHTSAENVFACGDCAEFEGVNYCLWSQAISQGEVAGANAAGEKIAYTAKQYPMIFHGFDTQLYCCGKTSGEGEVVDETETTLHINFYENEKLCGFILIGDTSRAMVLTKVLENNK